MLFGLQLPPSWGIKPVPKKNKILKFIDYFALWSSLGVGLLVLEAGALLVPGLNPSQAFLAIVTGTVIGSFLLALVGLIGSEQGIATMVLSRCVLGWRGSYLASFLNLIQLVGWTAFELWVMAQAVSSISQSLWGFSGYGIWLVFFALLSILLALGGPLVVIRQWLEKFGIWLVWLVTALISFYLLRQYNIGELLRQKATGEISFWLGVDLVVAMPISWIPLVADYNRFAKKPTHAFWGTFVGYLIANIWFYSLGILFVLTQKRLLSTPADLATAVMSLTGGTLALLVILVDEIDNVFADIYSSAISLQNVFPRINQRLLIISFGFIGAVLAAFLTMSSYFWFLLLIGSVFVPLFGIVLADYFLKRHRDLKTEKLYRKKGEYWYWQGVNWRALASWFVGLASYHLITHYLPTLGASIPSFIAAFLLYLIFSAAWKPLPLRSKK